LYFLKRISTLTEVGDRPVNVTVLGVAVWHPCKFSEP
jgi:hypothetical protein